MAGDKKEKKEKRKKEKKEKRHKHEKREKKHKKKRHRDEDDADGGSKRRREPSSSLEPAEAIVARLISASPKGAEDVRGLLSMLDAGEALVLSHIKDKRVAQDLERLSASLGMQRSTLQDGSVAHSLRSASAGSLTSRFGDLLDGGGGESSGSDSDSDSDEAAVQQEADVRVGAAGPSAAGPSVAAPDEAAAPTSRVYGVAARPEGIGPAVGPVAVGPIGPDVPGGIGGGGSGDDGGGDDDDDIGPRLPGADEPQASSASAASKRWWEREVQAPQAPAPIPEASRAAAGRDDWMMAPPPAGGASGSGPGGEGWGEARGFARNGVTPKPTAAETEEWTETPAEREAKEQARRTRANMGMADAGSGGRTVPLSLAEVAAQAQAKGRTMASGSGGGGGGEAEKKKTGPAPKTLVEVHQELAAKKKAASDGKQDWEGKHPWRPWNRETDLTVRTTKTKEQTLNDKIMGSISDRFGGGRRETTFM